MGLPTLFNVDAWHRHGACGADDFRATQTRLCRLAQRCCHRLINSLILICAGTLAQADSGRDNTIRIATFAAPLSRDGPGLLVRDIMRGDAEILAIAAIIAHIDPDILVFTDFDYDLDLVALNAFADLLDDYPHRFALRPNTGMQTGLDLDGNGRFGDARDGQGYGRFAGDGGLAILSRYPFGTPTDLSALIWSQLPFATLPQTDDGPFPSPEAQAVQRLSSTAHWAVPVMIDNAPITLLAWSATPPVFDGPEDMNGLRSADELRLWLHYLDGEFGPAPDTRFVAIGNANLDPNGGDGDRAAMAAFLADPRFSDPLPNLPTAHWGGNVGDLRVDYVLPSADMNITDAGVFWPASDDDFAPLLGEDGTAGGAHRMVWVDVAR